MRRYNMLYRASVIVLLVILFIIYYIYHIKHNQLLAGLDSKSVIQTNTDSLKMIFPNIPKVERCYYREGEGQASFNDFPLTAYYRYQGYVWISKESVEYLKNRYNFIPDEVNYRSSKDYFRPPDFARNLLPKGHLMWEKLCEGNFTSGFTGIVYLEKRCQILYFSLHKVNM